MSMSTQDLYTLMSIRLKEMRDEINSLKEENNKLKERLSIVEEIHRDSASISSSSVEDVAKVPEKTFKVAPSTFKVAPSSFKSATTFKVAPAPEKSNDKSVSTVDISEFPGFDSITTFKDLVNSFSIEGKDNKLNLCKNYLLSDRANGDMFFLCLIWAISNFMVAGFKANRRLNNIECKNSCLIVDKFEKLLIHNKKWAKFFFPLIGKGNSDIIKLNREKVFPIHEFLISE